ncbi:tetratricopeptide repeat-containing glycosyltransferase family protein [Rhizobium sp. TRM95796]|uniref:tetratricopeptide repeat-containing glycosyltransferase family protein n=1 Tax=Rhizobium sp. TRM95796 TaxID=2979862 RepID=UPI0021E8F301|nr:tetratricopeptide repeat-containing glycosyltransferase family protein [Rhizobium sp. TRM95796]MCV3765206.1 tetratricopeptide repeat-containing glycosyltransferase family protein [Rhizobium sp. TRM95796]
MTAQPRQTMNEQDVQARLARAVDLHKRKDYAGAIAIYREVLASNRGHFDAQSLMASALRQSGRLDQALQIFDDLAAMQPARPEFWFNRGNALTDAGRFEEAISSYRNAMRLAPPSAQTLCNLAIALAKNGELGEAEDVYRRTLELEPAHKVALHNLGNLLVDSGRSHEGIALLRRATALWPDAAEGHYNLGLALMRLGDFANGFREYEWRWQTSDFKERPSYRNIPEWQGEPLAGKRLIVHGEQGLGDTIQFARLLGLVASLGGDVVFHVPEKLAALMSSLPFPVKVTGTHGASDGDFHTALLSLPHRLKLTLGAVPSMSAHLTAPVEAVSAWKSRLGDDGRRMIGLVWKGNPNSPAEKGRSLSSPDELAPFAAIPDARLIALQKLDRDELEPTDFGTGWRVRSVSYLLEHPGPDADSGPDAFVDTAAIMTNLDLVVSVCTAPLHLAGALGRPTIALLRAVPDWRWQTSGDATPWYPTMRLERQSAGETYQPVIARAAARAEAMLRPN